MQNHILADAIDPVVGNATGISHPPLLTCGATCGINGASYINICNAKHRIKHVTTMHALFTGSYCFAKEIVDNARSIPFY
jgi:hypothetical protein